MKVTINGEEHTVRASTLGALIDELGLDRRKIAVELNFSIVPRSLHGETPISDGDRLELVQFVGGG